MSGEFLTKVKVTTAGTYKVGIPHGIRGVYANNAVSLGWEYNGEVGELVSGITHWEPQLEFCPGASSKLVITTTSAAEITIRMV